MKQAKASITFYGGAGEVSGSNFLLDTGGERFLIDCGLFQGCPICGEKNAAPFPYDPASVDALFATHAHIDHIGRIPKLVKDGFRGSIYSTPPTKDIAAVAFEDALGIMEEEARKTGAAPLYEREDFERTLAQWRTADYRAPFRVGNTRVSFKDAGHVLGSSMIDIEKDGTKIVFTGDLGNSPSPLLPDTEEVSDAAYLVMESVYGDRNHETHGERRFKLEDVIEETARKGGVLMIPAFSVERTQEVLYEIERMIENHRVPQMPVFVDSPLAIKVTEIYKKYDSYFNKSIAAKESGAEGLFSFLDLHFTESVEESKRIKGFQNPKIIIAGSGMSEGGRILYHEKEYLPDESSTLLIVGYQAPGTRGREIQDGTKLIRIFGEEVPINARVETIRGYSSHKDAEHLLEFAAYDADAAKKVFVAMGEPKSAAFLTQRLRDYLGIKAVAPQAGETYELEF